MHRLLVWRETWKIKNLAKKRNRNGSTHFFLHSSFHLPVILQSVLEASRQSMCFHAVGHPLFCMLIPCLRSKGKRRTHTTNSLHAHSFAIQNVLPLYISSISVFCLCVCVVCCVCVILFLLCFLLLCTSRNIHALFPCFSLVARSIRCYHPSLQSVRLVVHSIERLL